ncbi:fumarate/nitrate reduction transcriptional regulator Fnr [Litoribacillus peritrichatus]|uniref:Fumarate/nitrate reduction transcriptional regulator Fnr n=1 Tax=Litoribacillus peritrichatus TaxID=718191 RepID=A0ABP7N550_9GAMM
MSQKTLNSVKSCGTAVSCQDCTLSSLCLPISLDGHDVDRLDAIIKRGRPFQKSHTIWRQGDDFQSVLAIRSGSVKSFVTSPSGEEQIVGFHFAGELIGLNGLFKKKYPISTVALETTTVCDIPYDSLDALADDLPELRDQILHSMSQEISEDQQMMLLLSKKTSDQRLATFLVSLSERFHRRGYSATRFRLTMSRNDLGNFLGLAVETISRIFSKFQQQEILRFIDSSRDIELLDMDTLYELADLQDSVQRPCGSKSAS